MKLQNYLLFTLIIASSLLMQCAKQGPAGPAGIDGEDANTSCLECHSGEVWNAIEADFEETKHNTGTSWAYAGNRGDCNWCHSSAAYIAYVEDGIENGIASPGSLKCNTCHGSHTTFDDENMTAPMRDVGPVASVAFEGEVYDFGTANICATCHQARRNYDSYDAFTSDTSFTRTFTGDDIDVYTHAAVGPNGSATLNGTGDTLTVVFDVPTDYCYISSTHGGPHHGPQADFVAGMIGYEAGAAFDQDHHTCSNCHEHTGGHTFEPDIAACDECHGTAVDITAMITANETRFLALQSKMEEIHAIHVEDGTPHPMYASLPKAQFQAWWDFMCMYEDKSMGIHNPTYFEIMMNASESTMGLK